MKKSRNIGEAVQQDRPAWPIRYRCITRKPLCPGQTPMCHLIPDDPGRLPRRRLGKREGLRLAEKFREEGKREGLLEGKREGLFDLLRLIEPELARQFEPRLKACQTLEQPEGIEGEIRKALTGTKRR